MDRTAGGMDETVGARIARYRKRAGLTQQDLAVAIGVAVTSVSRWERDASQPHLDALREMATVLRVTVTELVG